MKRTGNLGGDHDLTFELANNSVKRQQQAIRQFISDMRTVKLSHDFWERPLFDKDEVIVVANSTSSQSTTAKKVDLTVKVE